MLLKPGSGHPVALQLSLSVLLGTAHALEEGTLAQCWFLNLFTTSLQGS